MFEAQKAHGSPHDREIVHACPSNAVVLGDRAVRSRKLTA
ncbi:MAG: hypothetical protein OJF50_004205 [Nitrospira sp.]|nr:hypothetical protein [Nitrospira sp.]